MKHLIILTLLVLAASSNFLTANGAFDDQIDKLLRGKNVRDLKAIAVLIEKEHEKILGRGIRGGLKEEIIYNLTEDQLIQAIKGSIISWNKLNLNDLKKILYEYYFLD